MKTLMHTEFMALLARAGVTQAGFARLAGVTARQVNNWARGRAVVPQWAVLLAVVLEKATPETLLINVSLPAVPVSVTGPGPATSSSDTVATGPAKRISVPVPLASCVTLNEVPVPIPVRRSFSLAVPLVTVSTPWAIVAVAPGANFNECRSIVSPAPKPEIAAPTVPA